MKDIRRIIVIAALVVLAVVGFIKTWQNKDIPVDQFYTINNAGNGRSLLTWYDEEEITVATVNKEGRMEKSIRLPLEKDGKRNTIEAACIGEDNTVYLLVNALDRLSGEKVKEDLYIYNFNKLFPSKTVISTDDLQTKSEEKVDPEADIWDFGWMSSSGKALSMIGVNQTGSRAVRKVFEFGEVTSRSLNVKSERVYPLAEGEGIYQAIGNGTDIAYVSNSGKLYHATEKQVQEVYPAREVEVLMYPLYVSFAETGFVYLQDAESGNILKLNLADGSEEVVMKGTAAFSASEVITPSDICMMSMVNLNNFSAVVKDNAEGNYRMLVVQEGAGYLIEEIHRPLLLLFGMFISNYLMYLVWIVVLAAAIYGLFYGITKGKTIMAKLMLAALPLMILAMSMFGVIAYSYYSDSVLSSYQKQTEDEGNMMTALFGQESFNALEYPYDYNSDNYRYLEKQMEGRDLYSRVIYFENGQLYTGVDKDQPCFYPIGINMNSTLDAIYRQAAMSGQTVTATIQDQLGQRIVSVTPMGGSAGRSVYLYEAGVFTAVLEDYQGSYITSFVWICVAFLIVVSVLLTAMFLQILEPLREIRQGMELFTGGNRNIRIEPETSDELADICHTFNKMADDIDLQIMNLQNLSDTYYRFMPLSIIGILGKDNLGNLNLGSRIEGNYPILSIHMKNTEKESTFRTREEQINRFFNLVNTQAVKQNAIPIVDRANLSGMLLICKNGVASAIRTALTILASADVYNAGVEEAAQLNIMCLLHRSDIFVGICGDEERYIPVLITPELENILQNENTLQTVGARLIVTGQAYDELESDAGFGHRYIGDLKIKDSKEGFYEFYDDRNAKEAHLLKITDSNFRKAMKLFEEGYLYEAKNLFAMVLQDNPDDMVARYYIFRCE